jgi:hypothetical protein
LYNKQIKVVGQVAELADAQDLKAPLPESEVPTKTESVDDKTPEDDFNSS